MVSDTAREITSETATKTTSERTSKTANGTTSESERASEKISTLADFDHYQALMSAIEFLWKLKL